MVKVSSSSGTGVVDVVVLEVLEEGLRIFLNLDLRLNDLGRDVDLLVVGLWVVVSLSLLDPNLDLVRNRLEGFLEKDLVVGLGEVVEGSSSEGVLRQKFNEKGMKQQ